ncbi:MAG: hypothetical protein JWN72_2309 [Thermoleophilia bacterium]|nr:hypothetical protein [Thermoleophilia bacterium]
MSVLVQTFIPGMTSVQYDATTVALQPLLQSFEGFLGFHAAAVVDGGLQINETWVSSDRYRTWISEVVATKVPAEAVAAMQTTFTPLHNVVLSGTAVTA